MTDSTLLAKEMVKIYNGRANIWRTWAGGVRTRFAVILMRKPPSGRGRNCSNERLWRRQKAVNAADAA